MRIPARADERAAVLEYCEGDLAVWQFETDAAAHAFCCALPAG